jgi:uncharacterized membrane protein YecN with MAPEG domain
VITWGLAGSILNLAGMVLLLVTAIAGAGTWRRYVVGALLGAGGVCTVTSFRIRRRRVPERPSAENPHQ